MAECPGVYQLSSMRDGGLARVRIPGGHLTADQFRTVARLAETCGNGLIDLTNRANIQIRGLKFAETEKITNALQDCELLCIDPDADRIRNITASPLAGYDDTENIDVTDLVRQLDEALQLTALKSKLSPKFAFVIDGGGRCSLSDVGHDIGFYAGRDQGVFAVSLAGRSTSHTITASQLVAFSLAAIEYGVRSGETRMANLVADRNAETVLKEIATSAELDITSDTSVRPAGHILPLGPHEGESTTSSWYNLGIPLARLTASGAHAISDLADLAAGTLRVTPWQSIVLPETERTSVDAVEREASKHGWLTTSPAIRVVACAGCTGCERTEADTKADGQALLETLSHVKTSAHGPRVVHLSGCPRGCAHPDTSDFLVLAREGSANYTIHADSRPSLAGSEQPIKTCVPPKYLAGDIIDLCQ